MSFIKVIFFAAIIAAAYAQLGGLPVETPALPVETPALPVETPALPVETPELPVGESPSAESPSTGSHFHFNRN